MSQQLDLFTLHNIEKSDYYRNLKKLDFNCAYENLEKWDHTFEPPENKKKKKKQLKEIEHEIGCPLSLDVKKLAKLIETYKQNSKYLNLYPELHLIVNGLTAILAQKLITDQYDFISPSIHPAEIFIETQKYNEAIKVVDRYIEKNNENAYLRQLQSFAYYQTKNERSALICLSFALFNNPLACKEDYLINEDIIDIFNNLKNRYANSETAWQQLPYILWEKNIIPVLPKAIQYESYLIGKLMLRKKEIKEKDSKNIKFLHLLYISEAMRIRNEEWNKIKKIREQMKHINPEMFQIYLNHINK